MFKNRMSFFRWGVAGFLLLLTIGFVYVELPNQHSRCYQYATGSISRSFACKLPSTTCAQLVGTCEVGGFGVTTWSGKDFVEYQYLACHAATDHQCYPEAAANDCMSWSAFQSNDCTGTALCTYYQEVGKCKYPTWAP